MILRKGAKYIDLWQWAQRVVIFVSHFHKNQTIFATMEKVLKQIRVFQSRSATLSCQPEQFFHNGPANTTIHMLSGYLIYHKTFFIILPKTKGLTGNYERCNVQFKIMAFSGLTRIHFFEVVS